MAFAVADPQTHKVVRWRCIDLQAEVARRWSVAVHESTIGKWLDELGQTRLQPRPVHPKKDAFGGPVIKSGDPVEQEKQLKYATLIANAIMLSNVADLTEALAAMAADGHKVTAELTAATSPYIRRQIRRFGRYELNMNDLPDPLSPRPLPFEIAW